MYVHKNQFAPQPPDLLEKLAECLINNFHRKLILLKLKMKKLLRKISSKNLTAGVFGSVVECLNRDRGVTGSSLTGGTLLCP